MNRPRIAALIYSPAIDPAPVLAEAVRELRMRGVALAGALQHGNGSCAMELELLPSGLRVPISQNLGSGATGCRLDTMALADAASMIRQAIEQAPALAVFNKFGVQEADGRGMHAEIVAAVTAGVPVLIAVGERFLNQWSGFTGGEFTPLSCTASAALAWWDALPESRVAHEMR